MAAKGGDKRDTNNMWRSHEGHMIDPTLLLNIFIPDAHGFDHCARGEIIRKIKKDKDSQNNVRKGTATPIGSIPVLEGPFKHLVMDYEDMIKSVRGKRYRYSFS